MDALRERIERDFQWLQAHPEEEAKYEGEHIAVYNQRIVAHGKDLKEVEKEAKKHGERPLYFKVPKKLGKKGYRIYGEVLL